MFLFFPRKTSRWVVSALFAFALVLPMRAGAAQALPRCCVWRVTNAKAPFYLVDKNSNTKVSTVHGLDNYFVDRAKQMRREIGGLESVDEHVAVLGGLSDRDGEIILRDALTGPKNGAVEFNRMLKAWRTGNTDTL